MTTQNHKELISPSALAAAARTIRCISVDAVEKADSGHPGAPLGQADIATEIFANHLRHQPADPQWPARDRFVLSCGHASALIYSMLHITGYDVTTEDLQNFRQWGSKTPGHPEYGHTPGVETTTGPLGQGVGNAVGMALAGKMRAARLGHLAHLGSYRVFGLCSDGDLMEGIAYEAASFAGHLKLDNLVLVYDDNKITIDGNLDLAFSEDVQKRFEAIGWITKTIDGNNGQEIQDALVWAESAEAPVLILARTKIGFGSPNKQGKSSSHGSPLGKEETLKTKAALGAPEAPAFFVSPEARAPFAARRKVLDAEYEAWRKEVAGLSAADKALLDSVLNVKLPGDLWQQLAAAAPAGTGATRVQSGKVQQKVAELVPGFVGGSADLGGSVKTTLTKSGAVARGSFEGRNIHFGIREHGMGSILNGMAVAGGFVPFGATFLIFGDYMRPPMRLAALMHQRVIYVLTHDSIFLGEDGPTHQPVEQLWTMRMVPGLHVVRPADGLECAAAWAYALEREKGPTVLALTRQDLPELPRPAGFDVTQLRKGAYVVQDVANPEMVVIATGSEVHVALEAAAELGKEGRRISVVSMPCVDAFLELDAAEQAKILPPGVPRASFELGITWPWRGITGDKGIQIGVDTFGASAPAEKLAQEYGVTAPQVAAKIRAALAG